MYNKSNKTIITIVYTALSIAMVTLLTMAIKIPSVRGGYINFGDIMIFMAAIFFGKRTGFLAGSMGSALSDILLGYSVYAPATFIIKGLEGFICGLIASRIKGGRDRVYPLVIAMIVSAAWMVLGYFLFEYKIGGLIFGNSDFGITTALLNLPGNIVQGTVSAAAALPFILAIRKTNVFFDYRD